MSSQLRKSCRTGWSVSKSKRMGNNPPRNRRQLANPDHSQLALKSLIPPRLKHSSESKLATLKLPSVDGHTEVWTHSGDCYNAKVSPKGNVGWIRIAKRETGPSGKTIALNNDSLVVHLLDGTTKKFPPLGENHFIPDWRFADDDKAVIVRSAGYHGPASYVQYDLASGKVIDSRGNGYTPYAKLPAWAKPLADPVIDE